MPSRPRDRVGHQLHDPVRRLGRPGGPDQHDLPVRRVHRRQLAGPDRGGQPGDRAAGGLPVERGQLDHRDGPGLDQVGQHPARPDRGQLGRVADEQQVGAVGAGLQQRGGQLDVEHARLVDDDQLGVQRPLLAPGEPTGAALGAEQPVQRGRGRRVLPSSSSRLAARPVGAASATARPCFSASRTSAATVRLLPVPGPPVSTLTPCRSTVVDRAALGVVQVVERGAGVLRLDRLGGGGEPGDRLGHRALGHRQPLQRQRPVGVVHGAGLDRRGHRAGRVGDALGAERGQHQLDRLRRCGRPGRPGSARARPAPGRGAGRPAVRPAAPTPRPGRPRPPARRAAPAAATGRRAAGGRRRRRTRPPPGPRPGPAARPGPPAGPPRTRARRRSRRTAAGRRGWCRPWAARPASPR